MKSCVQKSNYFQKQIDEASRYIGGLKERVNEIGKAASMLINALKKGKKVLTAGNGGSAAEALHMAEELCGRFRTNRRSLPGMALTADPTAITCIGNDFGFDYIFSRQIEGLGRAGDILVLFSTSGNAANLKNALYAAKKQKMRVICLLGRDGGMIKGKADVEIIINGDITERIQETHQVVLHLLLDAVENAFIG